MVIKTLTTTVLTAIRFYVINIAWAEIFTIQRSHWHDMIHGLESRSDRDLWFAIYRDDGNIDDFTFINDVERGHFRLHPAGKSGIGDGCITLPNHSNYAILMQALLNSLSKLVSSQLRAFGTMQVY